VLNVLFKTLQELLKSTAEKNITVDNLVNQNFIIQFSLLRGWLDILLTKATPKPETFFNQPFNKAFCRLNDSGELNLLMNVSAFLINHINYGGMVGVLMASETIIVNMSIAEDLLKLLIYSEGVQTDSFALNDLFQMINVRGSKEAEAQAE